jgi:hypothetical protein
MRFAKLLIVFCTLLSQVKAGPKGPKPAPNPVCSPPVINVSVAPVNKAYVVNSAWSNAY